VLALLQFGQQLLALLGRELPDVRGDFLERRLLDHRAHVRLPFGNFCLNCWLSRTLVDVPAHESLQGDNHRTFGSCVGHLIPKGFAKAFEVLRDSVFHGDGRLVNKIPLLFSDIFALDVVLDEKGKPSYRMQTVPDTMMKTIRTSIKGLEPYENITIDFAQQVEGQGLGGILTWEKKKLTNAA